MNKLTILCAAAAIAMTGVGLAHADEETPRSRAEVVAELDAARASGELAALIGEDSGDAWLARQAQPSSLTRQQVQAETQAAQMRGEMAALLGEDSGSMYLSMPGLLSGLIYAGPNIGPADAEPGTATTTLA